MMNVKYKNKEFSAIKLLTSSMLQSWHNIIMSCGSNALRTVNLVVSWCVSGFTAGKLSMKLSESTRIVFPRRVKSCLNHNHFLEASLSGTVVWLGLSLIEIKITTSCRISIITLITFCMCHMLKWTLLLADVLYNTTVFGSDKHDGKRCW